MPSDSLRETDQILKCWPCCFINLFF